MYSKIFIAFIFLVATSHVLNSQDILSKRILRYNKIEEQRIKVDSAKIFYNLKFVQANQSYVSNVELIKSRSHFAGNFSFFWLLISLLFFSYIRYKDGSSYWQLFSSFFTFKNKERNHFGLFKNALIGIAFICLFSYLIFLINHVNTNRNNSKSFFFSIVYSVIILLVYRLVVFHLVKYIFNLSKRISGYQFVVFDVMYIFVFISLPILFLETLINAQLQNIVLIGVLAAFIFLNTFMYYKIFILNTYLLTRNVFKVAIYFYVVEIIPILLFLKYLKLA